MSKSHGLPCSSQGPDVLCQIRFTSPWGDGLTTEVTVPSRARNHFHSVAQVMRNAWVALGCLVVISGNCAAADAARSSFESLTKVFAGTWQVSVHEEPIKDVRPAEDGRGEEFWTLQPGEVVLTERYQAKSSKANDFMVFWWDQKESGIRGVFCAAFTAHGCNPLKGSWGNNTLVLTGQYEAGGAHFAHYEFEATLSVDANGELTQIARIAKEGGPMSLIATIKGSKDN
jgi:hypothetical protein